MVSSLSGGVGIGMHFSSCKSINTKAIIPPSPQNSLSCLQFLSSKCIDFPSSLPHHIKGRGLYSVRWSFAALLPAVVKVASHSRVHSWFSSWLQLTLVSYYLCLITCFSSCNPVLQVKDFSPGTTGLSAYF